MDHCAVIPSAKMLSDHLEGVLCKVFGKKHRKLPGLYDSTFPGFFLKLVNWDFKIVTYGLLDKLNGYFSGNGFNKILDYFLCQVNINFFFVQGSLCQ